MKLKISNFIIIASVVFLYGCSLSDDKGSIDSNVDKLIVENSIVINTGAVIKDDPIIDIKKVISDKTLKEELDVIDYDSEKGYNLIMKNYLESNKRDGNNITNLIRVSIDLEKNEEVLMYWKYINDNKIKVNYNEVIHDIVFAYINLGMYNDASKIISDNISKYKKLHFVEGIIYMKNREYDKAIDSFKKLDKTYDDVFIDSLYFLAKCYKINNDIDKSIIAYNNLLNYDEKGVRYYMYHYLGYIDLKNIYTELGDDKKNIFYEKKYLNLKEIIDDGKALSEEGYYIEKKSLYRWINYISNL